MIYQQLKPDHPKLSLGTVYRNLNQLADWGEITRMPFHVERYDADTSPHAHFCCDACGRVFDLPMPAGEDMTAYCGAYGYENASGGAAVLWRLPGLRTEGQGLNRYRQRVGALSQP